MNQAQCFFDSLGSAARGLEVLLIDARSTSRFYEFEGMSAQQLFNSGLILRGDIEEVCDKLEQVTGAAVYREGENDE